MPKSVFTPELPCEYLVRKVSGRNWRDLSEPDINGAWGVAIVKSVLDGIHPDPREIASHLGVSKEELYPAFRKLSLNGVFLGDTIYNDTGLLSEDLMAWCYYAGYASGATGTVC